jgi:hypothetical protein
MGSKNTSQKSSKRKFAMDFNIPEEFQQLITSELKTKQKPTKQIHQSNKVSMIPADSREQLTSSVLEDNLFGCIPDKPTSRKRMEIKQTESMK